MWRQKHPPLLWLSNSDPTFSLFWIFVGLSFEFFFLPKCFRVYKYSGCYKDKYSKYSWQYSNRYLHNQIIFLGSWIRLKRLSVLARTTSLESVQKQGFKVQVFPGLTCSILMELDGWKTWFNLSLTLNSGKTKLFFLLGMFKIALPVIAGLCAGLTGALLQVER